MTADINRDLTDGLNAVIDTFLAAQKLVGMVLVVLQDGEIRFARTAGLADRETGRVLQSDAIFRYASLTKPIVTAAVMRLIEQGQISLRDPITRYLPDFRPRLTDGTTPVITLHHLLTHTAGLSYGFWQPADGPYLKAGISDGLDAPGRSFADNLARIAAVPLAYAPGTKWGYSVALDVLGAALEAATSETLPALVERLVTGPLGMRDTAFLCRDQERLAVAYSDSPEAPVRLSGTMVVPFAGTDGIRVTPDRYADPASFPSAGAGMLGTAGDFARFLEAIRTGGAPILTPESVMQMMRGQIGDLVVDTRGPGWSFGYGWAVLQDPVAAAAPQHAGTIQWGGVYGHSWFVDPVARLTVIGLTNTAVAGMTGAFPMVVRDAVYAGLR
ncbi:MAG TPA: serine hydrolase domain-containing protein [Dongiaceae bacterium]|nr:serine hydrolase domain-containing protein [Dongiaceae bacterium]